MIKKSVFSCVALMLICSQALAGQPKLDLMAKTLGVQSQRLEVIGADVLPGWTVFLFDGTEYFYIKNDMKYIYARGDVIDIETGTIASTLLEEKRRVMRKAKLATIEDSLIVYPAIGKEKASIVVFADSKMPYTARLHILEVQKLNKQGVTVKYAASINSADKEDAKFAIIWNAKNSAQRKQFWDSFMEHYEKQGDGVTSRLLDYTVENSGISIGKEPSKQAIDITSKHTEVAKYVGLQGNALYRVQ